MKAGAALYSSNADIEPVVKGTIGDEAENRQMFPVFVGFLIAHQMYTEQGSEAEKTLSAMIKHYANEVIRPAVAQAQSFMNVVGKINGGEV